jgi:hypothetical protein
MRRIVLSALVLLTVSLVVADAAWARHGKRKGCCGSEPCGSCQSTGCCQQGAPQPAAPGMAAPGTPKPAPEMPPAPAAKP